jgi:hypothetical protein
MHHSTLAGLGLVGATLVDKEAALQPNRSPHHRNSSRHEVATEGPDHRIQHRCVKLPLLFSKRQAPSISKVQLKKRHTKKTAPEDDPVGYRSPKVLLSQIFAPFIRLNHSKLTGARARTRLLARVLSLLIILQ